jgi:hypothetical protein
VQRAPPHLVEADEHVERRDGLPARRARRAVRRVEVAGHGAGGDGELAHAALHEVAGGRGLGQLHDVGARVERRARRQQLAEAPHVGGVRALDGLELDEGEGEHGAGKRRGSGTGSEGRLRAVRGRPDGGLTAA